MALTLIMMSLGWIPFHMAAAMVLGENIGTTITANLAAITGNTQARRAAMAHLMFNVFGADRIAQFNIQMGETLTVSFDIDSREYNGRWYTDVRAWRIEPAAQAASGPDYAASAGAYAAPTGAQGVPPITQEDPYAASAGAYSAPLEEDDLPF